MEIDKTSLLVTVDTDHSIEEIERFLSREGFTLNYQPLNGDEVLLADALNERTPNLYASAFGEIEDLCLQLRVSKTGGKIYENTYSPRAAVGPSFKKVALGSSEMLGVPIQATLRIFYKPEVREVGAVFFDNVNYKKIFLNAIQKHRLPLPLYDSLPSQNIENLFPKMSTPKAAVGFAIWGTAEWVAGYLSFIRDLIIQKKGRWLDLNPGKIQGQLFEMLHQLKIRQLKKQMAGAKPISAEQIKLSQMIRGVG